MCKGKFLDDVLWLSFVFSTLSLPLLSRAAMLTDVMASLARSCELEHEFNSRMSAEDPDHDRDMSEYQAQAMKVKAEEEATRRAAQVCLSDT